MTWLVKCFLGLRVCIIMSRSYPFRNATVIDATFRGLNESGRMGICSKLKPIREQLRDWIRGRTEVRVVSFGKYSGSDSQQPLKRLFLKLSGSSNCVK